MIRVLHVVESFDGQAAEAWITRILSHDCFDAAKFHFDFFLTGSTFGSQAAKILECGCSISIGNTDGKSIPQMALSLRRSVQFGRYDLVHIHQDVIGGVFAIALGGLGVKVVVHAHNCWQRLPVGGYVKERFLTWAARLLTLRLSNAIVGVSGQALATMTGGFTRRARIDRVIYCSANVPSSAPHTAARGAARSTIRQRYSLATSAKVLLFLGRLDDYKNPAHALNLLCELIACGAKDVHLVIAGVGGLESTLRKIAVERNIESHLHLVGWVNEPGILLLAADLLVMPSREICSEGLGLAAVEAQALGTPVLCSLSIPEDAMVISAMFRRISLKEDIGTWRTATIELLEQENSDLIACWHAFQKSPFTDEASYMELKFLYEELVDMDTDKKNRFN